MKTKHASRSWSWYLALALVAALAGCVTKRIVWSPDGQHAAVLGEKGLYLCDAEGKLSPLLVPDVVAVDWFPDSRRLALVRSVPARSWAELEPGLPPEQRERIVRAANLALASLKTGTNLAQAIASPRDLSSAETNALHLYLKDLPTVRQKIGPQGDVDNTIEVATSWLHIGTLTNGEINLSPPLARTLDQTVEVRVAPGGTAIAYVTDPGESHGGALRVVSVEGAPAARLVADHAAAYPDWSPDGRALVYVKTAGMATSKDQILLGSLTRRVVLTADGRLEPQSKEEDLAGLLFDDACKVRCLKDGRILFSTFDLHLPTTTADSPERQQLFALDPDRQATLTRLIPRNAEKSVPDNLNFFEVSPDGKRLCLLGENNAVVVFTLATGSVETVQAPLEVETGGSAPVWRPPRELCFVAVQKTNNATPPAQVALWDNGKARVLSRDWPADVRKGLLEK